MAAPIINLCLPYTPSITLTDSDQRAILNKAHLHDNTEGSNRRRLLREQMCTDLRTLLQKTNGENLVRDVLCYFSSSGLLALKAVTANLARRDNESQLKLIEIIESVIGADSYLNLSDDE